MTKFIVNNRTGALKNWQQFVFYDNKLSNFPLSLTDASDEFQIHVSVRILTIKINQWARVNFCSYRKYMLLAGWEVRIGKNCNLGLENAALGLRPRAAFSKPWSQFFPIPTDPKPDNNMFTFFSCGKLALFTQICHWIGFTRRLQTIPPPPKKKRANERVFTRQRKMY